ncbi:MAG: hypothetical protein IE931_14650 [Sphingobacteriales bacterium]|nr:hypothetical protein [Sphingobacteriales bacterium]
MGRYYSGDIEGKFYFGVQSSDSPSRFGGMYFEPQYITYYFDKENFDIEELKNLLKEINEKLNLSLDLDTDPDSVCDSVAVESISDDLLSDLADTEIGLKIWQCIKNTGECNFDAEF